MPDSFLEEIAEHACNDFNISCSERKRFKELAYAAAIKNKKPQNVIEIFFYIDIYYNVAKYSQIHIKESIESLASITADFCNAMNKIESSALAKDVMHSVREHGFYYWIYQ